MKYILYFFSCTLFLACQSGQQNEAAETKTEVQTEQFVKDAPVGEQNHNWTFLTNQMFHYRAGVTIGQEPGENSFKGQWLDLEPDGTFEKGKLGKTDYTGVWTYDHEKSLLTLYPDPKTEKNTQWNIKYNDDIVILIGTPKYGDNATQIQLVRQAEKPTN
jgi:hypothetical protein